MSTTTDHTIRVKLYGNSAESAGILYVDFDYRLHQRGSDFSLYANKVDGLKHDPTDTPVLRRITSALLRDYRSGVARIEVRPYTLIIHGSRAISAGEVMERIERAIKEADFFVNRLPDGR